MASLRVPSEHQIHEALRGPFIRFEGDSFLSLTTELLFTRGYGDSPFWDVCNMQTFEAGAIELTAQEVQTIADSVTGYPDISTN